MGMREFRCVCLSPAVYVYTFQSSEQTSNSLVPMSAWDEFAKITSVQEPVPENEVLRVDFLPFFCDNDEMAAIRKDDLLLMSVINGTELEKCRKYTYAVRHVGVGWDETVWSKRLCWCLKEQEDRLRNMGVNVIDLSSDGLCWSARLPTVLQCPEFSCKITPFKGVTDILVVGRKSAVLILSTSEEVEHMYRKFDSGVVVGIAKPKITDCKINGEYVPSKLAELLSSMYLIGVLSCVEKDLLNLKEIKVLGWLIFRGTFSIGVELVIEKECTVKILWTKANLISTMSAQFHYFLNRINGVSL